MLDCTVVPPVNWLGFGAGCTLLPGVQQERARSGVLRWFAPRLDLYGRHECYYSFYSIDLVIAHHGVTAVSIFVTLQWCWLYCRVSLWEGWGMRGRRSALTARRWQCFGLDAKPSSLSCWGHSSSFLLRCALCGAVLHGSDVGCQGRLSMGSNWSSWFAAALPHICWLYRERPLDRRGRSPQGLLKNIATLFLRPTAYSMVYRVVLALPLLSHPMIQSWVRWRDSWSVNRNSLTSLPRPWLLCRPILFYLGLLATGLWFADGVNSQATMPANVTGSEFGLIPVLALPLDLLMWLGFPTPHPSRKTEACWAEEPKLRWGGWRLTTRSHRSNNGTLSTYWCFNGGGHCPMLFGQQVHGVHDPWELLCRAFRTMGPRAPLVL